MRGRTFTGWCFRFLLIQLIFFQTLAAKSPAPSQIYHLAPSHWYTGFADSLLEIIINAENIDLNDIIMEDYPGVRFLGKTNSGNRHIAYLNLVISRSALPGFLQFQARPSVRRMRYVRAFRFSFELKKRGAPAPAITQSDVLYRIITDRFANGDEGNDNSGVKFRSRPDRNDMDARHGGDLKGVLDHTTYLKNLGVSTLWLNGLQVCDHPTLSHLGYSVSDHYRSDPRLGSSEILQKLVSECHKNGMKLMMDINPNDISTSHWLYQNFDTGWFNGWDTLIHPDYTSYSIHDPYYSPDSRIRATRSWLDRNSPDINHFNMHMRRYLDQAYLWWIETYGFSGFCINRVAFLSNSYLQHLVNTIKREFPQFMITTDTRTNSAASQASVVKNYIRGFEGNVLESVPDYHLHRIYRRILSPDEDFTQSVSELYMALSDDWLFVNPAKNLSFLDNSLESRCYQQSGLNSKRWEMAMALMFSLRGMPVLFYGTEILLTAAENGPYSALSDFPGGWKNDKKNKFQASGREKQEEEAYQYLSRLIRIRNENPALTTGEMMQYPVEKGIYVFFRYNPNQTIMILTNTHSDAVEVDFSRFEERIRGFRGWTDLISAKLGTLGEPIKVPGGKCMILKLN